MMGSFNHAIDDMTPLRERRQHALQPYVAALTYDIPEPVKQTNVFDKIAAKQQSMRLAKQASKDHKHAEKQMRKAEKDERKEARKEEKHAYKMDKHARASSYDSESSYAQLGHYQPSYGGQAYDECNSDTSSIISIEKKITKLDLEARQVNVKANRDAAQVKSKDLRKVEEDRVKELAKLSKHRAKLEEKLTKKHSRRTVAGPSSSEMPLSLDELRSVSDLRQRDGESRRDGKQIEKEEGELERLKWIVIQNHTRQSHQLQPSYRF